MQMGLHMYLMQRMCPMQHKNHHVPKARVLAVVTEQCKHHFFWARPDGIGLVGPSGPCAHCSAGHPERDFWVIFHLVPALQEDLT
jgi:hypothetical protein